ncbi:MAG: RsmD family RNA methyltransferase [Planctomycetia bacterium]
MKRSRSSRRGPGRPAVAGPSRAGGDEAASAPRIIGGDLRGRRLEFVPQGRTRPMKDRVRETLFDLLGTTVRGAVALDLFAGTGALGFEALSRGASRAILVERHFPTADVLRKSARGLGVADRVEVRTGDVLLWARRLPDLPGDAPWVAFVSPPWEFFAPGHERRPELLALVAALRRAAPAGSRFVIEADTAFAAADLPDAAAWEARPIAPACLYLAAGLVS